MAYLTLRVTKRVDDPEIDSVHVLQYFNVTILDYYKYES